jgi:hypothetical protein
MHRKKIRLIEANAKCRHLKNLPVRDFAESERERLENEQKIADTEKTEQERLVSERERRENGHGAGAAGTVSGRGWPMDMEQERLDSERERLDNGHGAGAAGQ